MIHINNNKTLFLLTKTYPFGNGEQYVTNELAYLAKVFDKVIIYPNDYYGSGTQHPFSFPANVEVLNFNQQLPSTSKNAIADYWYLIKNTFIEFIATDDKKYFFKNFKWNLINFWTQYQIAKSFSVYLKSNNYNLTNSVFYSYWFHKSAILLAILKDKKHVNLFVSRAHSVDLYHNKWGIINESCKVPPFKIFKLKHSDFILPISEHGSMFLKKYYNNYRPKISTNYLGVKINDSLNIKMDDEIFNIVTCSNIDINKRIHHLAEALLHIKKQIRWTHFGSGELANKLLTITDKFDKNYIEFDFKGNVSNEEVKKYYCEHQVNLFVNLSKVEGIPVSIMEAMAHEIPIVATQIYGVPEAVIDNKNGFLLKENFTIDELVQILNYCVINKDKLMQMGKASKEIYLQKFSAEKNYTEFANYLINL